MQKRTREWVRKAEKNFIGACILAETSEPLNENVCYDCQQCVEKYLKALLNELGMNIPRTHDLVRLRGLLLPHHPTLQPFQRGFWFLNGFGVEVRYPGRDPTKRQARAALRLATRVREVVRSLLGLRPRRKK
jgi:HEPN domain-containing protein